MSIRRLNYTKRRRLTLDDVQIELSPLAAGTPRRFDIRLTLPPGLPPDAKVFVEAYRTHPPARMRFNFGTVGRLDWPPADERRLSEFPDELPPLFRVKVTDVSERPGRLLAYVARLRPQIPEVQPENRRGILHIHHKSLDGPIWQLDFSYSGYEPTLWIDSEADPARELARDPKFIALVFPEVLRQTLNRIVIDEPDLAEDEEGWAGAWIRFARSVPGTAVPEPAADAEDEDKVVWIDEVVKAFARERKLAAVFAVAAEEDA